MTRLHKGDKFEYDGDIYEIVDYDAIGQFYKTFRNTGQVNYRPGITFSTFNQSFIDNAIGSGTLKIVNQSVPLKCYMHTWKRYKGIRRVYDYCVYCGEKSEIDWKLLKKEDLE